MLRLTPLAFLLLALPLAAQEPLYSTFSAIAAGYTGTMTTEIRLDPTTTGLPPGTTVNLERDLGLAAKNDIRRFGLEWRPLARHQISASYFSAKRSAFRDINQNIVFGDVSIPVQAAVSSRMGLDVADVQYTYWALKRPRTGLGVTLGVSALSIDAAVAARRPNESEITLRESASTDVPVPEIGLQFRQALGSRVFAEISGAALPNVKVEDIDADARAANARIEVRVARFLGVGIGYNYFDLHGDVNRNGFLGRLNMRVEGAEGYVRLTY